VKGLARYLAELLFLIFVVVGGNQELQDIQRMVSIRSPSRNRWSRGNFFKVGMAHLSRSYVRVMESGLLFVDTEYGLKPQVVRLR
jgi:hypothetical protein